MSDQDQPVYCGNAKKISGQYGDFFRLSLTEEDLKKMNENLENGWINVRIAERRSPSQGGMTHYLVVDKWKPKNDGGGSSASAPKTEKPSTAQAEKLEEEISPDDLPF